IFGFITLGAIASTASQYYFGQTLQIRWRRWLTERYVAIWMAEGRHYRIRFVDNTVDNIHLRIANDVLLFLQRTHELGTGLLNSVVALLSFAIILWGLSAATPLPLFGVDLSFPGYLVFAALAYAGIGTFPKIAEWKAIVDRLAQFEAAMNVVDHYRDPLAKIEFAPTPHPSLTVDDLVVRLPSGEPIASVPDIALTPGEGLLVSGHSG